MQAIPTRKESFVRSVNGKAWHVWFCQNDIRTQQLFLEEIAHFDPFVNHSGDLTAVKVWDAYVPDDDMWD